MLKSLAISGVVTNLMGPEVIYTKVYIGLAEAACAACYVVRRRLIERGGLAGMRGGPLRVPSLWGVGAAGESAEEKFLRGYKS